MYDLVHSLSVDFKTHDFNIKLFMCSHIRNFIRRMIETTRECTLTRRNLVCSMITISENATPKTILVMDPWCNCEKQEYQDFPFHNSSDLQHQHNQCECQSITKRDIFKLVLNILNHHLAYSKLKLIPNF